MVTLSGWPHSSQALRLDHRAGEEGVEMKALSTSWVNVLLPAYQPLQALEVLLLVQIVSQRLKDHAKAAGSSCQVTQLLLTLGCPSYAQVQVPATPACGPGFGDWLLFSEKMGH